MREETGTSKLRLSPPNAGLSDHERQRFIAARAAAAEAAVSRPLVGVTTDGESLDGLFPIEPTGVSTMPVRHAAAAFLAGLGDRAATAMASVDSIDWRRWSHLFGTEMRHGVCLHDLTDAERRPALELLHAALSGSGYKTATAVMALNGVAAALTERWDEFGEWRYWLTIFGTPDEDQPWGWQLDGHHLVVNCFVLGDQLVLTPTFMGSEPVVVDTGPRAGTRVFEPEEQLALALIRSLSDEQRSLAVVADVLPRELFTAAQRDNAVLAYEGIPFAELGVDAQDRLLELVEVYVGRTRAEHAAVTMAAVRHHLDDTWFSWRGGVGSNSAFYYRVHSPVLLVEFDHHSGVIFDDDAPNRNHIHTIVRTPNGNDYGADLLRQHHERFDHVDGRHVPRDG